MDKCSDHMWKLFQKAFSVSSGYHDCYGMSDRGVGGC